MKRKICMVSVCVLIILLFTIVILLYADVSVLINTDNRVIDVGKYNILQVSDEIYYQVCDENNMFDDETVTRIDHFSSLDDHKSIRFCEINKDETILTKLFICIKNSGEEITVYENNKKAEIYSRYYCSQYFVKKDFSLPKISPDEIESIVVADLSNNNILKKYNNTSDIKNILDNYNEFFDNTKREYTESYECYIIYKNYDLVEFISLDYFNSLHNTEVDSLC